MLGSMLVDVLSRDSFLKITATVRRQELARKCKERVPEADWVIFDAEAKDAEKALKNIEGNDWVINAIGLIRSNIHENNAHEVETAIRLNALFPYLLARKTNSAGAKVLQIATDCAFSGRKGGYTESDLFDPVDVYGKTKSLGEVCAADFFNLRTSIVGPVLSGHAGLLGWFLNQNKNARVDGYINHRWNGVTTLQFSKVCHGIINKKIKLSHVQHLVPSGETTKYNLLQTFSKHYQREDISVRPLKTPVALDSTLKTDKIALNLALWAAAGYGKPPTIAEMVAELANFNYRFAGL